MSSPGQARLLLEEASSSPGRAAVQPPRLISYKQGEGAELRGLALDIERFRAKLVRRRRKKKKKKCFHNASLIDFVFVLHHSLSVLHCSSFIDWLVFIF